MFNYTKEYSYDDKQRLSNEVDIYNNKSFNYDYSYNEQIDSLVDNTLSTYLWACILN